MSIRRNKRIYWDINAHYDKITRFRNQVKSTVEKIINQCHIPITKNPEIGFFYNEDYESLLNTQLNHAGDCLLDDRSIDSMKIGMNRFYKLTKNEDDYFHLGNFLVGKGDDALKNKLENVIQNIPYSREFLLPFSDLYKIYILIDDKYLSVHSGLDKLINDIDRHLYNTKVICCK